MPRNHWCKPMNIAKSNIVKSTAGRDEGDLFFVLDIQGEFLLLIRSSEKITNSELRKALAACTGSGNQDQEGL